MGRIKAFAAVVAVLGLIVGTMACGGGSGEGGGEGSGEGGGTIALLLPESKTTRYESQDRPIFEQRVGEVCPECEILYSNADQDAAQQQQQAEAAITNGAEVLVLDPVDSDSAVVIVERAAQSGIPVISYDRLINDAPIDYYISFDNERVGELQGQFLVDTLGGQGTIVMINGAPTDNNAGLFKAGVHSVIDGSGLEVGREYDTPDWSPDEAQQEMDQAITALGRDQINGVYAANDGTAGGAIAAMRGAGFEEIPPVTGQDAELEAIQRILGGTQSMTVYKAISDEASTAADMAVALLRGEELGVETEPVDNGVREVPSVLLEPVVVTSENVNDTVVADGFHSVDDICTSDLEQACQDAGIL